MKKFIISLLASLAFISVHASTTSNEALPVVNDPYLELVMQNNIFAASAMTDREFIITLFLANNQKKFFTRDLINLKETLKGMSDQELLALSSRNFKDPTVSLILSVLLGNLGVDRFYIGDIGAGVGKLLTLGGFGIWWIIDLFNITDKTKENNHEDIQETIMLNNALLGTATQNQQ